MICTLGKKPLLALNMIANPSWQWISLHLACHPAPHTDSLLKSLPKKACHIQAPQNFGYKRPFSLMMVKPWNKREGWSCAEVEISGMSSRQRLPPGLTLWSVSNSPASSTVSAYEQEVMFSLSCSLGKNATSIFKTWTHLNALTLFCMKSKDSLPVQTNKCLDKGKRFAFAYETATKQLSLFNFLSHFSTSIT